jgi:hypothetical protein
MLVQLQLNITATGVREGDIHEIRTYLKIIFVKKYGMHGYKL